MTKAPARTANRKKQGGFFISSESLLVSSALIIGMTAGLETMRDALVAEMEDLAEAIGSLDQSYAYNGIAASGRKAGVSGSSFGDAIDRNAGDGISFDFQRLDNIEGIPTP